MGDRVIRECWWMKIKEFKSNLNAFMLHSTVFLSQSLNEFDKVLYEMSDRELEVKTSDEEGDDDINLYGHFDAKSFADSFDCRIVCYLLTANNQKIGGKNKK